MHLKKYLIISLVCTGLAGLVSISQATDYPKNFTIQTNTETNTITLIGINGNKTTVIKLPEKAKKIHTLKFTDADTNYLLVLYQNKTKLRLVLYHANGQKICSRLVNERKTEQVYFNLALSSTDTVMVQAIKQTKQARNKYYLNKTYIIDFQNKKFTKNSTQISTISKPTDDNPLNLLNYYRLVSGFFPVTESAELTDGCQKHVNYMEVNNELTHVEDENKSGYTEEGALAGMSSVLSHGRENIAAAIQGWMDTLYHRLPLLNSDFTEVGYYYDANSTFACLQGWEIFSAREYTAPLPMPTPQMTDVPTSFYGNETPDPLLDQGGTYPSGTVITLSFSDTDTVTDMQVTLIDQNNQNIAGYLRLPNDPADPNQAYQYNTVSFIPKNPLNAQTKYTVTMTGTVNAVAFSKIWSFTTE